MNNVHERSETPPLHENAAEEQPNSDEEGPTLATESALQQTTLPKHSHRPMTAALPTVKKKKRVWVTLQDKIMVLDWMATNKRGQSDAARHFQKNGFAHIKQSTISRWVTAAEKLRNEAKDTTQLSFKRPRIVENPLMEASLRAWCLQKLSKGIKLTGDLIRLKAQEFEVMHNPEILDEERMSFSSGWLEKFKQRLDLREYKSHGEAGSAKKPNVDAAILRLRTITDKYHPDDIFNFDESGLNYRMPPDRGLAQQQLSGIKGDKTRLTYGFCVNATGTVKLEPLIIGHSKKPRCFKRKFPKDLGFLYYWNKKAWMTGSLFSE